MPKNTQFPFILNTKSSFVEYDEVDIKSKNELVYADDNGNIIRKCLDYRKVLDIFSAHDYHSPLRDIFFPSIKEIENDSFSRVSNSLRWKLTKYWFSTISDLCKKSEAVFCCFSLPIYYFLNNHWVIDGRSHPFGSRLALENQISLLNQFSNDLDFHFFDIYHHAFLSLNEKNYDEIYIDPSYAYFSDFGCEFIGDFVNEKIRSISSEFV